MMKKVNPKRIRPGLLPLLLALVVGGLMASCRDGAQLRPVSLTCEYLTNPTTVGATAPRLSWINQPASEDLRGVTQSAWQIMVATSKENLLAGKADAWDSGQVQSAESHLLAYAGSPLRSGQTYWWKVRVWDGNGQPSRWSEPASWGMGLLDATEWKAQWIGAPWQGEEASQAYAAAPLFRKPFTLSGDVATAKAFVTGLGYFELYANGSKVGDDCLVPNFTNYTERPGLATARIPLDDNFRDYRVMYLAYDLTGMLKKGENAIGAIVGNGFYNSFIHWVCPFGSPRFLCQLEVEYTNGQRETIITDETWLARPSAIVQNDIYAGEVYDANQETPLWSEAGCPEAGWQNAVLRQAPRGRLTAHTAPTDKVIERLRPVSLTRLDNGSYEVDFGKEISGWISFKDIEGHKGDTLNVHYICESPLGIHKYVFKGEDKESHAPRFTWYVFSKAVISGIDNLEASQLSAETVSSDVPVTAEFSTSNSLFNQINTIWQQSQIDNMHGGIASDCPHRERSPYTGDGQVVCETVMHNFDAASFYQKWIRDMRDAQNIETGYVPNGAPWQPGCGGGVAWGAAMNIMPWQFYLQYGDLQILEDNYFAMKEQVRYMQTWLTPRGTMLSERSLPGRDKPFYWLNLGDWGPAYKIPSEELVHTFYLWYCADITARAAQALGNKEDAARYSELADRVNTAFHKAFYDAANKTYGDYGSNVFALVMGVPAGHKADVVETLRKEIVETYNGHLNTGIFATRYLFEVLAQNGMNDVAYEAMNKRDYPSFGHWIDQGATVTWEFWNGEGSRNHPMFGGGLVWFYRQLAGINIDENEPGYRHIIIRPVLSEKLEEVSYANQTPFGRVASDIVYRNNQLQFNVTIPVGSHATVHIPLVGSGKITEGTGSLAQAAHITDCGSADGYHTVKLPQGHYTFEVE